MRRSIVIAIAVAATLALAGAVFAYRAVSERSYSARINGALDEMLVVVNAESEVLDLWSDAVESGYTAAELPPEAASAAAQVLSRWRGLQSEVAAIRAPARYKRSYGVVVAIIELRIRALEALVADPLSDEYNQLWAESEAKMDEYKRTVLEESGGE